MKGKKSRYGEKRFSDLKSGTVEYRGKEYKVWDVKVSTGETVLFGEVNLLTAITENGDDGCRLDDQIAYYADPDEKVADAVEEYLD